VSEKKTAGSLSRILWDDADLQIQTELRLEPKPVVTTILVRDGEVLARVEKPWEATGDLSHEQQQVHNYHDRLTRAIEKLHEKRTIKLDDLGQLAERLVKVALRHQGSQASEVYSLLPGAIWAAVASESGEMLDVAPSSDQGSGWCEKAPMLLASISELSKLLGSGQTANLNLKAKDSYILMVPKDNSQVLIAEVEAEQFPEAKQIIKRLVKESGE
jgi:hypothetical protein